MSEKMIRPLTVKALPKYRIYLKFTDGAEGEVDLSDLAGQGVFAAWEDENLFNQVHIGGGRQIRWTDELELCPDALYLRLTGKTPEELFPQLQLKTAHA